MVNDFLCIVLILSLSLVLSVSRPSRFCPTLASVMWVSWLWDIWGVSVLPCWPRCCCPPAPTHHQPPRSLLTTLVSCFITTAARCCFPGFICGGHPPTHNTSGPPPFVSSSSSFTQIIHSSWSVFVSPSRVESTVQKFFYPQTQTDFLRVRFSFHLTFSLDLVTFQTQLRTRCLETHQVTFSSRTAPPLVHSVDCGVCRVFLAHGRVTFGLKSCVFVLILTQQAHKQTKRIQTPIGLVER